MNICYRVGRTAVHGECGTGRRAGESSNSLMGLPGRQRSRSIHVHADARIGSGTTRSSFVDLSHDNNSGQTYTINQVTGLSYSTSTYPDLERGGQARRGGGWTLTIPCLYSSEGTS